MRLSDDDFHYSPVVLVCCVITSWAPIALIGWLLA